MDQVKVLIRDGALTPGDRLPSERELCQRFGVSRVTVREALRILEASGLVTIRVGAHGGAFLTAPSTDRVGEGLADLLTMSALTAGEVTETRKIVELGALPLIVERATDDDIDALFKLAEEGQAAVDEDAYTVDISARFHIRLAECAHNTALAMLIQSFHGPMLMSLREAREHAPAMGKRGTDEHRRLAEAIRERDLAAAQHVMSEHIARTAQRVSHGAEQD
ncbi:FCD domain-containing protein [Amycolatopsis carbonis]|uniref:FCD domain-containing protein n=1 Tax=Amycolatopsis carbonis TaxID=715471 RepID=A0A9Y2IIZ2_9PSEU|nr:FCD domain-containing protein [Amycolatopsis sp. 2-15]WIX79198.1 FCD domain-containing protein [Amycolatopsis sp. 2-15]